MPTRTLLIDNYDSFTYNLFSLLAEVNGLPPTVVQNDSEWSRLDLSAYDNVVISPGPGRPDRERDFGISSRLILEGNLPTLGVCLGHQGLCHVFGGVVGLAPEPVHGRISAIRHTGTDLFAGLPSPLSVVRYHSLIVDEVPAELEAVAWTTDGLLMAVRHRSRPLWGVQFHPESICSEGGRKLLENFRDATPTRGKTPALAPIPAVRPVSPYVVESVRVDHAVDPSVMYEKLFANGMNSFWLDGSAANEPDSRFSVMGDCSGPHAEYITYSVREKTVRIHRRGLPAEEVHAKFFDYIDKQLTIRSVPRSRDLPFGFGLGYVGYLGYELKAEAGGQEVHTSEYADAAMVFADRAVVIDHENGCCYLLCLAESAGDPDLRRWLRHTAAAIRAIEEVPHTSKRPVDRIRVDEEIEHPEYWLRHDRDKYLALIDECLNEIRAGETYEVCLTNVGTVDQAIDPFRTFRCLREISPTPYSALLQFGDISVLSASPERFLRVDAHRIVESKPIKGTRPRGATAVEDEALRQELLDSEKDHAEQLMIVDLVRNDLARACETGSVHVPKAFDVETYASVHQLVSTVRGTLRAGMSVVECVRAAFPGGSMTGAPKIRTMEIIDRMEDGPRGVYSGAVGYFSLSGTADFSIVIRTMVVTEQQVRFGIGGAIVAMSDPDEEFEETLVKAAAALRALAITVEQLDFAKP